MNVCSCVNVIRVFLLKNGFPLSESESLMVKKMSMGKTQSISLLSDTHSFSAAVSILTCIYFEVTRQEVALECAVCSQQPHGQVQCVQDAETV